MPLSLIYITNSPAVALIAEKTGVDLIMVDLETLGKEERQKNMDSVKSHHSIADVQALSKALTKSTLLVRINPINADSADEIDRVIAAGARAIMLPMWKSADDVKAFTTHVSGRVKTILLLETKEAVECLDDVLSMGGFDEVHIGLNDLHLSYGMTFMFELLSNGVVEAICTKLRQAGIPYGFGGIAKIGEGTLPAERIVMEHYRLGSIRAILSRSFCNTNEIQDIETIENIFVENVARLRSYEKSLCDTTVNDYEANKFEVQQCVTKIVKNILERKKQ